MTIELAYKRRGSGEPVVLIHGIGHRKEAFDPIFDDLTKRYDVIAVDLPGFGVSPRFPKGTSYTIENVVDTLVENFALWGIERPHLVGNSLGGLLSIATGQAGHASSVTGLSPAGYFRPWSLLQAAFPLMSLKLTAYQPAFVLKAVMKTSFGRRFAGWSLYRHPDRLSAEQYFGDALTMRNSKAFWPMLVRTVKHSITSPKELTGVARVPTTMAWAERDLLLHPSQGKIAIKRLKGSELVMLRDCGHVPMVDDPAQNIAVIEATIARAGGRPHAASSPAANTAAEVA